ncbi:exported hypothetical protein [Paraburkholderia piptadeniae]|uniref:Purine nucleoside phosphorylase n=1 Tax=Paraburkholderia piptadeniae TaxID=1701573 RepID=A0A1N7SPB9_9BURK|nr:DUF4148 domain-containing protein [Paraburkholderia piptadeniae]SIT49289.1 exported hypothetical protein [Paraburkholderia piptadeniae]
MRHFTFAVIITALSSPAFSQVQSDRPLTHAEVLDQIITLEKAGYQPQDKTDYPSDLQRAKSIVAHQDHSAGENVRDTEGPTQARK